MITYLPFNQIFPVLLVTMDDLKMIEKYYLPFSEEIGRASCRERV